MNASARRSILQLVLAALILAFLGYVLLSQWDRLIASGVRFHPAYFAIAVAANIVFFAFQAEVWRRACAASAPPMPTTAAWCVWASSQVAKYVPGKVMLPLVRIGGAVRAGTTKAAATIGLYIEIVLMIASSAVVFVLLAGRIEALAGAWPPWVFPSLAGAGVLGLHPRIVEWGMNLGLRLAKRDPIELRMGYSRIVALALVVAAGWLVHGLSALACVAALGLDTADAYAPLTGVFALSWLVGFLSFLTPGGLGVREGILVLALKGRFGPEGAVAISLVSRLAWIAAETVMAGALWPKRPRGEAAP
ncbi:MAG: flippase-like domain-containing protein [Deltaproteobacteria bacterium]|nr:flippase-like domain-containing protein [Deltaproteobacteria bacterium]